MAKLTKKNLSVLAGVALAVAIGTAVAEQSAQQVQLRAIYSWKAGPSMTSARSGSCSAILADGRLLVSGGANDAGTLVSAEILDATRGFSSVSSMTSPRQDHLCAALRDGTVLVAGGRTDAGVSNGAEIYTPDTDEWSPIEPLTTPRAGASATTLKDGSVLIAGGSAGGGASASLEIYNPSTKSFRSLGGTMSSPRQGHAAAMLADGRVLLAGGSDGSKALDSVDIFDPASGTVSFAFRLSTARTGLSATILLDGNVLLAGGSDGTNDLASAEVYVAATGKVNAPVKMSIGRSNHVAISLPGNNSVLFVGGTSSGVALSQTDIYVPWRNSFEGAGALAIGRSAANVAAVGRPGTLMVIGGRNNSIGSTLRTEIQTYATLTSDKPDYHPGQIVTLTGTGWQPNETVQIVMTVSPKTHDDVILTSVADTHGNFTNSDYVVKQSDFGVTFYVTATGLKSGNTAALLTFTDGGVDVSVVGGASVTGISNNDSLGLVPATCTSANSPCTSTVTNGANLTLTSSVASNWTLPSNVSTFSGCTIGNTSCVVTRTNSGSGTITVTVVPTLTSVALGSTTYAAGNTATLTGTNFSTAAGGSTIQFGASAFVVTCSSATSCTAPIGKMNAGTYAVSITTNSITTGTVNSTINPRGLTVTAITNSKTYDGTTSAAAIPTITGTIQTGDTAGFTEAYSTATAGTNNKTLVPTGTVTDGNSGANYTVTPVNFTTGTISRRPVTYTAAASTKNYDGTTSSTATPTLTTGSLGTGDTATATETYDNASVGSSHVMTPSVTIKDGSNVDVTASYIVTATTIATGVIDGRPVTYTAAASTKSYDGNTTSTGVPTLTSGTLVGGDTATATETYDNASVGSSHVMTPSVTIKNGSNVNVTANYTVTGTTIATGVITGRPVTYTAAASTKNYDGNTTSTGVPTLTSGTLVGGDTATATETYDNANVGITHVMTPSVTIKNGSNVDVTANYTVTGTTIATGVISGRPVTYTAAASSKTYDGNTTSTGVPTLTSGTLVGGDTATATETYDNANVGITHVMTPSVTIKNGSNVDVTANYSVTGTTIATGVINVRPVTYTAAASTKSYDGNTTSTGVPTLTSGTLVGGDMATATETYDNASVGSSHVMTPSVTIKNGSNVDVTANYTVTAATIATGIISGRPVTYTAAASTKNYDGNTTSTGVPTLTSGTLVGGDTTTATEAYDNASVGSSHVMTPSVTIKNGSNVDVTANYTVTAATIATGIISGRPVTYTAAASSKTYDGNTTSTGVPTLTSGALVGGDTATATETYDNANVGSSHVMTPSVTIKNGSNVDVTANYTVTGTTIATGVISSRPVTYTAGASSKGYDGNTTSTGVPTLTSGTLVGGDTATATESYDNANAGTTHVMTPSVTIKNASNVDVTANYAITGTAINTGVINKTDATINVSGYAVTYNGSSHTATGTATGIGGADLSAGLNLTATTHTNAATYTGDAWTFTGGANYNDANGTVNDSIGQASSSTVVTGGTFGFDGSSHGATVSVTGAGGLSLTPAPSYSGSCSSAPVTVAQGTSCLASYTYAGDTNHTGSSNSAAVVITTGTGSVALSNLVKAWTGGAQSPTVTANASYTPTGFPVTNVGAYAVSATISDPNYTSATANGTFIINSPLTTSARSAQVTLSWKAYAGASGYTAYMVASPTEPSLTTMLSGTSLPVLNTTAQATGLTNGTLYWFVVVPNFTSAGNAPIAGAATPTVSATPKSLTP